MSTQKNCNGLNITSFIRTIRHISVLSLEICLLLSTLAWTTRAEALKPPRGGTPPGRPIPGPTRPEANCPETSYELTALFENQGHDFTQTGNPTFWFYIPYDQQDVEKIQLVLWNEDESEVIYAGNTRFSYRPGFLGLTLPDTFQLEQGRLYHWYLSVYCSGSTSSEPDKTVDGWIYRVDEAEQDDRENHLWYDDIDLAARNYYNNPVEQLDNWRQLLERLGASEVLVIPAYPPAILQENQLD